MVRILTEGNNGLYTNDWLIGDARTNETAILLLETKRWKLWRSTDKDLPGGTAGFLWSVNNAKDSEVRKEYVPDPANAPRETLTLTAHSWQNEEAILSIELSQKFSKDDILSMYLNQIPYGSNAYGAS